jgi:uncharacterized protein YbjT (DUF2867 family)
MSTDESIEIVSRPLILLTGASGYVGGRLLFALEQAGFHIRCIARNPDNLKPRVAETTEVVAGNVLEIDSLRPALAGIDIAYYLVHSMGASSDFEETDRKGAENFATAAKEAGIQRIIYLGGLGDSSKELSTHLRSRHEVADIFRSSGVQVIEFQASVIIGSGSLSFEMVRGLVERLPVMITPKWVFARAQPIAITDVISYLVAAATLQVEGDQTYQIGGPDQISYEGLMKEYAKQRGLKRYLIPVPFLTPRLSSLWLGLVTPLYARVGRKLIDSIQHSTIVEDDGPAKIFGIHPIGVKDAIALAMRNEDKEIAQTHWSDAFSSGGTPRTWTGAKFGNRLIDTRTVHVNVAPEKAFTPIRRIGGKNGWYYGDPLWRARGFLDLLVGGIGVRRGRRNPETVVPGDAIDFWRVEVFERDRHLRLSAEMKLPGRAWLDFEVTPDESGCTICQTALFDPIGIWGLAYWYLIYPLHQLVFAGMIKGIARRAESA